MHVTALIRIQPPERIPQSGLHTLLQAARRMRAMPGFVRWQTFRAMDASDTHFLVVDWSSMEALRMAAEDRKLRMLAHRAAQLGFFLAPVEVLPDSFERSLGDMDRVTTLLRLCQGDGLGGDRDGDLALRSLGAPGSVRVLGAVNPEGTVSVCRIDFDCEDGVWCFMDSPMRQRWSTQARDVDTGETWALNLPRLECESEEVRATSARREPRHALSVQLDVSEDGAAAELCLQGWIDAHGSAQCEKLCRTLVRDGCRRLRLDVSGLQGISPQALAMLARTARSVKSRGGKFTLIDNEARVRRITRTKHLESSIR